MRKEEKKEELKEEKREKLYFVLIILLLFLNVKINVAINAIKVYTLKIFKNNAITPNIIIFLKFHFPSIINNINIKIAVIIILSLSKVAFINMYAGAKLKTIVAIKANFSFKNFLDIL